MLEQMWEETEVEFMRSQLFLENWLDSPLLPEGWKVRSQEEKIGSKEFLSKEVTVFKSYRKALEYIKSYMSESDVQRFDMFAAAESKVTRTSNYEWFEDPSLPKGWRMRTSEHKQFFIAPTNEQFTVRRQALKFMIDQRHPEEDIEFMRKHLSADNWEDSPLLPQHWKVRHKEHKSGSKDFLTKSGEILRSTRSAIEHVKSSKKFSKKDLDKLEEFALNESRKSRGTNYVWLEDKSLPQGWKMRKHPGPKQKVFFLAPNGDSFATRRQGLKFMIDNCMKERDIEKMRDGLSEESWNSHKLLPKGWRVRAVQGEKNIKCFLTTNATKIEGFKRALQFIKDSKDLAKEDVSRFEEFSAEESNNTRNSHYNWMEDDALPSGWKMRSGDGIKEREFFLAPNLTQFTSRRTVYQYIIQKGYPVEDVKKMRESLVTCDTFGNNWEVTEYLPEGWLYRETSSKSHVNVNFLSVDGQLFESYKTVTDHMMDSGSSYTQEDVDRLKVLLSTKSEERRASLADWKSSTTLPAGWKQRTAEGKHEKPIFLSPGKDQYMSRKLGLQSMIKSRQPEKKVQEMRDCLKHEGWETSKNLPPTWLYRPAGSGTHGSSRVFLTTTGEEIKSFSKALEYMMMTDGYSDGEMDRLQTFIDHKTNQKRQSSDNWIKDETVPDGWMSRIAEGSGKQFFLGPDGEEFPSRRTALQHMLSEGFSQGEVEQMRKLLQVWQRFPTVMGKQLNHRE